MLSIETFNIEFDFPDELIEIANNVSAKTVPSILKKFESVYDYIAIIYYFRFIEKLENSLISKKLTYNVPNFHRKLYHLGWNFSNDYDENNKIKQKEKTRLNLVLENAKIEIRGTSYNRLKRFRQIVQSTNNIQLYRSTYKKFGIKSKEEYLKVLFYLVELKENPLTTTELAIIFDLSLSGIQSRLRAVGLNSNHTEAIAKKKQRKRQDYGKSIRNGKATTARDLTKNLTGGSQNENYFRSYLSLKIYDFLPSSEFDIIIGINNTGILGAKEIDIPVMIYSISSNVLYRFALEYNGERYHNQEDDQFKLKLASRRGWIYVPIVEKSNDRVNNEIDILEHRVMIMCENIKDYVENSDTLFSVNKDSQLISHNFQC